MSTSQPTFDVSAARAAFLAESGSAGGIFRTDDGAGLFYRQWRVPDGQQPARVAVFLHGIGNHSGAYDDFARYIARSGTLVYGLDLRGHGLSDGPRGTMNYQSVIDDIIGFFGFVRQMHPDGRYIMIGESMGAAFALRYASMRDDSLSALVLVAPALTASDESVWDVSNLAVITHLLFGRDTPVMSLLGRRLEISSTDTAFKHRKATDSLALMKVSANYLLSVNRASSGWKRTLAKQVTVPTLILQGGRDRILNPRAAGMLRDRMACQDKELVYLPDAYHTLLWGAQANDVYETIRDWLDRH